MFLFHSYELGAVYLQLCEMLYLTENKNYEKLVDPSIYIPRFANGTYSHSFLYLVNAKCYYYSSSLVALSISQETNIYIE